MRRERKASSEKVEKTIETRRMLPARSLGALRCTSRGFAHATTAHATSRPATRTSGKCDSEERRGARYDGALQDGRSGETRLPGECARRENKEVREKERRRATKERGDRREGALATTKRKVTPKRWHTAVCWLCQKRISPSGRITGSFAGSYKVAKIYFL